LAARRSNALIAVLLNAGAELDRKDLRGRSALDVVILESWEHVGRAHVSWAEDNSTRKELFETLVAAGAKVNSTDAYGETLIDHMINAREYNDRGYHEERQFLARMLWVLQKGGRAGKAATWVGATGIVAARAAFVRFHYAGKLEMLVIARAARTGNLRSLSEDIWIDNISQFLSV